MAIHLFYQGTLSNWAITPFVIKNKTYNCVEQYMMWGKAVIMGDKITAQKILEAKTPKDQKKLGRQVTPYDEKKWAAVRVKVVILALKAKFAQNPSALAELLNTKGQIAEASPRDLIWGIGLCILNPKASDPTNWRGQNLLGIALTKVRDHFSKTQA